MISVEVNILTTEAEITKKHGFSWSEAEENEAVGEGKRSSEERRGRKPWLQDNDDGRKDAHRGQDWTDGRQGGGT